MSRCLTLPLLLALAGMAMPPFPALAQHSGHARTSSPAAQTERPAPAPADAAARATDHAAHGHPAPPAPPKDPSVPGPDLRAPTAADLAAAFPDLHGMDMREHMNEDPVIATFAFEQLEHRFADADDQQSWEARGWLGTSRNKLWLRSGGEVRNGRIDHAHAELLWGRPTGPWWDALLGIRHDHAAHGPGRTWLAFGVQGLAPYKFEVSATGYLGTSGRTALALEAEYELLLTNRLILQPLVELEAYGKADPSLGVGSGLSTVGTGLRLRYEITRRFAPYVGITHARAFGGTARMRDAAAQPRTDTVWVAGLRLWF